MPTYLIYTIPLNGIYSRLETESVLSVEDLKHLREQVTRLDNLVCKKIKKAKQIIQ
jgi:hypothetical protein